MLNDSLASYNLHMSESFMVYVDESGDEGFVFGRGSSEWFVLSAVITKKATDLDTVKLVDRVRQRIGIGPKEPLHFRDLRHEKRVPYIDEIQRADLTTVSICFHKPSITNIKNFCEPHRLYFYAVRYLLERVSWFCRDCEASGIGDGSAKIIFSNKAGMSYEALKGYMTHLEANHAQARIEWRIIKPDQICAFSPGKMMGLLIADAVATSLYFALTLNRYGYNEDKFATMLKPTIYAYRGRIITYGLKFWPNEVMANFKSERRYDWVVGLP